MLFAVGKKHYRSMPVLKPDPVANGFHAEHLPDSANDEVGAQSGASVDEFFEMPDFTDDGESG